MSNEIYTIGHSTHEVKTFLALLTMHSIQVLADVRSSPYSRFNPQFNRETLQVSLKQSGIRYVFLGKELGARSDDPCCYDSDKVQYERLAQLPEFRSGLDRVIQGARNYRIVLMCAEKDPLDCHRTILVSRELIKLGASVRHILDDGALENHDQSMDRLLSSLKMSLDDLFATKDEIIAQAYRKQANKIAYDQSRVQPKDAAVSKELIGIGTTE